MKSLLKGVLILLIGMISLSGYSTNTFTPEKKKTDSIAYVIPAIAQVGIIVTIQPVSVGSLDDDVGLASRAINYKDETVNQTTAKVPVNPPPLE